MAEFAEGSDGNAAANVGNKTPLIWQLAGERGFWGGTGNAGNVKPAEANQVKPESVPEVQIEEQPEQNDHGFVTDMSSDQLLDFIASGELSKMVLNSPIAQAVIRKSLEDEQTLSREQGLSNMPLIGCFKTEMGRKSFGEYSTVECLKAKFSN